MKAVRSQNACSIRSYPWQHRNQLVNFLPQRQQNLLFRGPAQIRKGPFSHRRFDSTWQKPSAYGRPPSRYVKKVSLATVGALLLAGELYVFTDTTAVVHESVFAPNLRWCFGDAEEAHEAAMIIMKTLYRLGIHPRERADHDVTGELQVEIFGQTLSCPLAISAGLDKNGDIVSPLFALGPSIVEIGGITPLPQQGNPKPRVFRIPSQNALINRYGLNSRGAENVAEQLRRRVKQYAVSIGYGVNDENAEKRVLDGEAGVPPGSLVAGKLLAIQIAKNSNTPEEDLEAVKRDYISCVEHLAPYADILVINVSSPNQKGLRNLQKQEPLQQLLAAVADATKRIDRKSKPAIMVKVSPDEDSNEDIAGICHAVREAGIDGVIVGNTTRARPSSEPGTLSAKESNALMEPGGYSGPWMFPKTLSLVKKYRQVLDQPDQPGEAEGGQPTSRKVIFASGGICSGENVKEVLDAGASVAMVYTTLTTRGVGAITTIKKQLREVRKE